MAHKCRHRPLPETEPRFHSCLVIDAESLASFDTIPDELPPLRCATSSREKVEFLGVGYPAWVWLLEANYMAQPAWHDDAYPGWLKLEPWEIKRAWLAHLLQHETDHWFCLWHVEKPRGSGVYFISQEGPSSRGPCG